MVKKERLKIGLLYLGLHNQLVKKFGYGVRIRRKEIIEKLGRHYMIPKYLRPHIIKEMSKNGLIIIVNRDEIELVELDIDIENDYQKVYSLVGISFHS